MRPTAAWTQPAVTFAVYGLDSSWRGPRWFANADQSPDRPPTWVALAHADQAGLLSGRKWVTVRSFGPDHLGARFFGPDRLREVAWMGLLSLVEITAPDEVQGGERKRLWRAMLEWVESRSDRYRRWTATRWFVSGRPTQARFTRFAGGWAGYATSQVQGVDIGVAAAGVPPENLRLSRLRSGRPYHFDLDAPLDWALLTDRPIQEALGEDILEILDERTQRRLHADHRRLLSS